MESLLKEIESNIKDLISNPFRRRGPQSPSPSAEQQQQQKDDQFMKVLGTILESIPIVMKQDVVKDEKHAIQEKVSRMLHGVVDIVPLHQQYLSEKAISEEKESEEKKKERESELHDLYCCILSFLWDAMSKYGLSIRQFVVQNENMMMLIEEKWAKDQDVILAHQAQSLLVALKNDEAFQKLFGGDPDGDQEKDPPQVRWP